MNVNKRKPKRETTKPVTKKLTNLKDTNPMSLFKPLVDHPDADHEWTLVYLHGYGCNAGIFHDAHIDELSQLEEYGVRVVLPNAPRRAITYLNGQPIRSWYDYTTNHLGVREDPAEPKSLKQTIASLSKLLDHELDLLGGDSSRLLIGGVSQGAITAMELAMRYPQKVGAFLGIAGVYSMQPTTRGRKDIPMFFFNGNQDKTHRWSWTKQTVRRFEKFATTSVVRVYPVGHTVLCSHTSRALVAAFLSVVCDLDGGSHDEDDDVGDSIDWILKNEVTQL